ncbi:M14 family metallocarboxypeptidase [Thalassotalea sp. M1531]|uniref:M14 family metallocarboxypeptidase n=1 Tax=Thalassotalea algicola TaxID=2716224 RepID=A0A7Y0LAX3_9GAMM|nr:M14 family metallocarboxypeptidase [Thalassotalea algicola]NMP31179.1 M14 family metallocarboxypeptidase [Thalassotalea algicola]
MSQYPIGTPGQKWGTNEKLQWLNQQKIKRSYRTEVVEKIEALSTCAKVSQYGELKYSVGDYPLLSISGLEWDDNKPTILITGGVHGYETSGVQGAIRFAQTKLAHYSQYFNIVITPCISPWGYETINRWNPEAIDPNRSFYADSPAQESAAVMTHVAQLAKVIFAHIDLHETTDTDNSEFRLALAAREGIVQTNWNIPDGFYLVGDTENPQAEFQKAMIDAVSTVTHIAPPDENGQIIGAPLEQKGVINYAYKALGLCAGLSDAKYATTTEVYPDSPKSDDENCILAQVASIVGGLEYIIAKEGL